MFRMLAQILAVVLVKIHGHMLPVSLQNLNFKIELWSCNLLIIFEVTQRLTSVVTDVLRSCSSD